MYKFPTAPFHENAALDRLPGFSTVNKFGFNSDVDSGATEWVWTGGGTFPGVLAAAETFNIVSSDGADTAAGTGARTVTLSGVDGNHVRISETVTLAGAVNVVTANSYLVIDRAFVASAGTGEVNAGLITGTPTVAGTARMRIEIGNGQTEQAFYMVPAAKTALMTAYYGHLLKGTGNVTLNLRLYTIGNGVKRLRHELGLQNSGTSSMHHVFDEPIKISEKTFIYLDADSSGDNTPVAGGFDLLLVDE
jgi:hypothetical protein